jgi:hypothetical protein
MFLLSPGMTGRASSVFQGAFLAPAGRANEPE